MPDAKYTVSVKVMRSYDYCHFEVNLGSTEPVTLADADAMRKEAARLADKAVEQYKVAKSAAERRSSIAEAWKLIQAKNVPEGERTPEAKAVIKYHSDAAFRSQFDYDYDDGWEAPDYDDED